MAFMTDCGVFVGNPADEDEGAADQPSVITPISTNSQGGLSLALSSTGVVAPLLKLASASTINAGNGVIITNAKIHVGRFKLKTEKIESDQEKDLESDLESIERAEAPEGSEPEEAELEGIETKYDSLIGAAGTEEEKLNAATEEFNDYDLVVFNEGLQLPQCSGASGEIP
jgi:hypothetical protein